MSKKEKNLILGERLRKAMKRKPHLNQTSLGDQIGVSRGTINKICHDKYGNVGDVILSGLSTALGVSEEYLTGESDYFTKEEEVFQKRDLLYDDIDLIEAYMKKARFTEQIERNGLVFNRVYGESKYQYINMNSEEFERFLIYILKSIENACYAYVGACKIHEESKKPREWYKKMREINQMRKAKGEPIQ